MLHLPAAVAFHMPCSHTVPLPPHHHAPRRLHVATHGLGTGKPLMLFLHGFPETWASWRHQIQASMLCGWLAGACLSCSCLAAVHCHVGAVALHGCGVPNAASFTRRRPSAFSTAMPLAVASLPSAMPSSDVHVNCQSSQPHCRCLVPQCRSLRGSTSWRPWTCAATVRATHPRCGGCAVQFYFFMLRAASWCGGDRWQTEALQCTSAGLTFCHPVPAPHLPSSYLQGVKNYTIDYLVSDVLAVVKAAGHAKCILVSSWGGGWVGERVGGWVDGVQACFACTLYTGLCMLVRQDPAQSWRRLDDWPLVCPLPAPAGGA